jgi:hypothetical protein
VTNDIPATSCCFSLRMQAIANAGHCECRPLRMQAIANAGHCECRPLQMQAIANAGHCECRPLRMQAFANAGHCECRSRFRPALLDSILRVCCVLYVQLCYTPALFTNTCCEIPALFTHTFLSIQRMSYGSVCF